MRLKASQADLLMLVLMLMLMLGVLVLVLVRLMMLHVLYCRLGRRGYHRLAEVEHVRERSRGHSVYRGGQILRRLRSKGSCMAYKGGRKLTYPLLAEVEPFAIGNGVLVRCYVFEKGIQHSRVIVG